MNYWESVYADDDRLRDLEHIDDALVFDWINGTLPTTGSAVEWRLLAGAHHVWISTDEAHLVQVVMDAFGLAAQPDDVVLHGGDSNSPWGVRLRSSDWDSAVPALLEIPEHHYFLAADHRWLLKAGMSGRVDLMIFDG